MDFDLTDEQVQFRNVIREFAEAEVAPGAAERDEREEFPLDLVRKMGGLGLFGLPFDEEFGGSGAEAITTCLVLEELGRVDQSVAITLSAAIGLAGNMVHRFGTVAQKERWLTPMCRGETLGTFCLTEPGGGSDSAASRTTACETSGGWTIDGTKAFITNAGTPLTAFHVVAAVTEPGGGSQGLSTFIVPSEADGVSVARPYRKMGWHSSDTREVSFTGCEVSPDALLGERSRGFVQCLQALGDGRIGVAALAVGLAQACLDEALAYAHQREAFGRQIGAFQLIQGKIADMHVAVEGARLATYRAAWLKDQDRPYVAAAALAKLAASEAAATNAREAVQVLGGYGFMEESPVARYYRDAKVLEIGEGTSEIQRLILARELGLPVEF
jgi:alkylation response protein AidB-like acyl-CoA dehydrogenase